jgi:hypothetical protein
MIEIFSAQNKRPREFTTEESLRVAKQLECVSVFVYSPPLVAYLGVKGFITPTEIRIAEEYIDGCMEAFEE